MKISELVSELNELMEKYGDIDVKTFDLDRGDCNIEEVEFYDKPNPHIFIC